MFKTGCARIALTAALALGSAGIATAVDAGAAGATGTIATTMYIRVNEAKVGSVTSDPVSKMSVSGLPHNATGTVTFSQGGSTLCSVTLPTRICSTPAFGLGTYTGFTALYSGDATYLGTTAYNSPSLTVVTATGSTTCGKIMGYVGKKVAFQFCLASQVGAQITGASLLSGGTMTWNGGKGTSTFAVTATTPGQGVCSAGHYEEDVSGTVTADTSTFITVGDVVAYDVCILSTSGIVKLVPGTIAQF